MKHWEVSQEKQWKEYCFNHSNKALRKAHWAEILPQLVLVIKRQEASSHASKRRQPVAVGNLFPIESQASI